jgi:hypothetical protein
VTDLPRRSYPLVVPPPGGFEEAVTRGRKRRRRQAGGSTGAALVFVGALAYSILGNGPTTNSLDPANDTRIEDTRPVPGAGTSASPAPQATPTDVLPGSAGGRPAGTGSQASRPTALPSVQVPPHTTRHPQGPQTRRYVARAQMVAHTDQQQANTSASCLSPQQTQDWCTSVYETRSQDAQPTYTLTYTVCRNVRAAATNLTFDRSVKQQADFKAIDVAHNDTVWTWSAGQAVDAGSTQVRVDPGYCVFWETVWNGFDDFGDMPPAGTYRLVGRSFARETLPAHPAYEFEHL